jgi:lysophospholipid acyltransferase (LPLAT)-like uncharacterized protein
MNERSSLVTRMCDWTVAQTIRAWHATLRLHIDAEDPSLDPRFGSRGNIYCMWHEDLVFLGGLIAHTGAHVVISRSRDGQRIARVMQQLGFQPIRGSSSRGGANAALEVLRLGTQSNVGITVDGPRGPRRSMQPGAVFLASRTGMPLVAVGLGYHRAWRAPSWDRMAFALPFSRAVVSASAAIHVPADLDDDALAEHRERFEATMHQTSARAEQRMAQWAGSGIRPAVNPELEHEGLSKAA